MGLYTPEVDLVHVACCSSTSEVMPSIDCIMDYTLNILCGTVLHLQREKRHPADPMPKLCSTLTCDCSTEDYNKITSPACNINALLLMSCDNSTAHDLVILACHLSCPPVSDHDILACLCFMSSDFHALLSWVGHAFLLLCR
jgi:hypothetical protein